MDTNWPYNHHMNHLFWSSSYDCRYVVSIRFPRSKVLRLPNLMLATLGWCLKPSNLGFSWANPINMVLKLCKTDTKCSKTGIASYLNGISMTQTMMEPIAFLIGPTGLVCQLLARPSHQQTAGHAPGLGNSADVVPLILWSFLIFKNCHLY